MTPDKTLEKIIKSILSEPQHISVSQQPSPIGDDITELNITAPQSTIGQIIGKQGKIIKSLRILMAIAFPQQKFNIQIVED